MDNLHANIRTAAGAALVSVVLMLVAFRSAESELLKAWATDEYSHGYFIPVIATLIGWHRLAARPAVLCPSGWCLCFFALAALLALVSTLSAFDMAEQYGLVLALAGVVVACFGTAAAKTLFPAFIYLLFAIPLPHLMQANLSEDLQLFSSSTGVWLLDLAGIPVFQDGNVIDLGGYKLQVAEACSGLRYLFPLMSFGFLVALLLKDALWKRIALFLSTIPIGIGLNALRIAFIGVTVDAWGRKMAEGLIHSFEGWVVFVICLAILMAETWVLMRIGRRHGHFRYEYLGIPRGFLFHDFKGPWWPFGLSILVSILMAALFGAQLVQPFQETIPSHPPFADFPTRIDDWQGHRQTIDHDILDALQLSDYWLANYNRSSDAADVNLYIAYYDSQRVGTTTHSPGNCIPGGGWQVKDSSVITFPLPDGQSLHVTRMVIQKDRDAAISYYWFDERGRDITETTYAKWYLLTDSLTLHRTDGALLRVITPVRNGDTAAADALLQQFVGAAEPAIKRFIPGRNIANTSDIPQ